MRQQPSDEQLDAILKQLVFDASLDDARISEIADSPEIWWAVKREISKERSASLPWPPSWTLSRLFAVCIPTVVAIVFVIALIGIWKPGVQPEVGFVGTDVAISKVTTVDDYTNPVTPVLPSTTLPQNRLIAVRRNATNERVSRGVAVRSQNTTRPKAITASEELKTEFIALSYASSPESGHVVRVKVPGSMMVSLGVVSNIEKPSNLVDAEVVIGDDGQTHAIRFIRQ